MPVRTVILENCRIVLFSYFVHIYKITVNTKTESFIFSGDENISQGVVPKDAVYNKATDSHIHQVLYSPE